MQKQTNEIFEWPERGVQVFQGFEERMESDLWLVCRHIDQNLCCLYTADYEGRGGKGIVEEKVLLAWRGE